MILLTFEMGNSVFLNEREVTLYQLVNKRYIYQRKLKEQSRMNSPEKMATLGTQDTG